MIAWFLMDVGGSVHPQNLMPRKLFALLVLATLGFGLLVGSHLCNALQVERESRQPSCHEAAEFPHSPQVDPDSSSPPGDKEHCCDAACRQACHMTAVAHSGPIHFSIGAVSAALAEVSGFEASRFAHLIDHVPLG